MVQPISTDMSVHSFLECDMVKVLNFRTQFYWSAKNAVANEI